MSFPRILPDSSNFPGVIPKFISKFDVRMNYHQSNVFLQDLSNSFIIDSTFIFFIMECLNNSWWFSSSFSASADRRRGSLKSCPFSWRFMVLAWCHPLIIAFDCENSFHPSGAIQESFQFHSPEPIISELSILSFQLLFWNSCGASFKYPLISSWSLRSHVSKSPQVSSFIFQLFSVNCAFATFIFNSYGGSFKISLPLLSYQIFVVSKSHRWFHQYLLKFALYVSLILFNKYK